MYAYEQLQYSQIGKGEKHIKGEKSPLTDDSLIFKTEFMKDVDWHVKYVDSFICTHSGIVKLEK